MKYFWEHLLPNLNLQAVEQQSTSQRYLRSLNVYMQPWTNVTLVTKPTNALCKYPWRGICLQTQLSWYPFMVAFPYPHASPPLALPLLPTYQGATPIIILSFPLGKIRQVSCSNLNWWPVDILVVALLSECNRFTFWTSWTSDRWKLTTQCLWMLPFEASQKNELN